MNWLSFIQVFKDLFSARKLGDINPITPIEPIEFPSNYNSVSLYANIPSRQDGSMSGSEFGQSILNIVGQQREDMIYAEFAKGNVPDFMRNFTEITISQNNNILKVYVAPNVLCVGSDEDYLMMPMNPLTAKKIMDLYGCGFITKKLADIIWQNADLKLMPQPIPPSSYMTSTAAFIQHNAIIMFQINGRPFSLITGHKKDIIVDKQLLTFTHNVAIYGWFYPSNGQAIQGPMPNCVSHSNQYLDYSHGVRIVARKAILNEQIVDLYDILKKPHYSYLINDEPNAYDASNIYK